MPGGDGTGPQGLGPGTGRKQGGKSTLSTNSPFQKSTLGEHFSLLLLCLSAIGLIKNSLKEKQGKNPSKMNLSRKII